MAKKKIIHKVGYVKENFKFYWSIVWEAYNIMYLQCPIISKNRNKYYTKKIKITVEEVDE